MATIERNDPTDNRPAISERGLANGLRDEFMNIIFSKMKDSAGKSMIGEKLCPVWEPAGAAGDTRSSSPKKSNNVFVCEDDAEELTEKTGETDCQVPTVGEPQDEQKCDESEEPLRECPETEESVCFEPTAPESQGEGTKAHTDDKILNRLMKETAAKNTQKASSSSNIPTIELFGQ